MESGCLKVRFSGAGGFIGRRRNRGNTTDELLDREARGGHSERLRRNLDLEPRVGEEGRSRVAWLRKKASALEGSIDLPLSTTATAVD
jgi:hypothetical protein